MFTGGHGMNPKYLGVTRMLDYETENIQKLIEERKWKELPEYERIKAVYDFVRDEILFGYNAVSYTHLAGKRDEEFPGTGLYQRAD